MSLSRLTGVGLWLAGLKGQRTFRQFPTQAPRMLHRQLKTLNRENDNCSLVPFSLSLCRLILERDFSTSRGLRGEIRVLQWNPAIITPRY